MYRKQDKAKIYFAVLLSLFTFSAIGQSDVFLCTDKSTGKTEYRNVIPKEAGTHCKLVKALELGMTQDQAREIVGSPKKSTTTKTQKLIINEWMFDNGTVLTFHDNQLAIIKYDDK